MDYDWNFQAVLAYYPDIIAGGINTIKLLLSSLLIAVPVGFVLGIIRQQKVPVLRYFAVAYIDFFRSSVALVLIYWCYFALPIILGISIDTFTAVTLAIGIQASAFMAEIVRGGIDSIHRGQWEAARALGMRGAATMRYVVLPQAYRRMIPVSFLLVVEIIKNTALAGIVAYGELMYTATTIGATTYRYLEIFTLVAAIYFVAIYSASFATRRFEKRLSY